MMKIIFGTLAFAAVAFSASLSQPRAINCEECIAEMHQIDRLVKAEALAIEVNVKCKIKDNLVNEYEMSGVLEDRILSYPG